MIRVKVCGITRLEDALLAVELGASAVGFVFWPQSPRAIDGAVARTIADALPPTVTTVGVFVDQPVDTVRRLAEGARLQAVQLHGSESGDYLRMLMHPVIKAVAVDDAFVPEALDALPPEVTVLLDAYDPVRRGGTGRTINWTKAAAAAERRPIFLSGGLHPDNIADAVARVRPYGVDISSGVETSPGVKDHDKLRALFSALEHA